MEDWIDIKKDDKHVKREREKAKQLRKSSWWLTKLQKGECHFCHNTYKPSELTMDHLVPVSRGGKSTKGNVVVACKACNSSKKYMTPVEILMNEMKNKDKGDVDA